MSSTPDKTSTLREKLKRMSVNFAEAYTGGESGLLHPPEEHLEAFVDQLEALYQEAEDRGFREGQRVGQYQAADRLYRHITSIYMFRDGDKKATAIADSNATELLKDCEKYLNHNSKVYTGYVCGDRYKRLHVSNNTHNGGKLDE